MNKSRTKIALVFILLVSILAFFKNKTKILGSGLEDSKLWKVKLALFLGADPASPVNGLHSELYNFIIKEESQENLDILDACLSVNTYYSKGYSGETLLTQALIYKKYDFAAAFIAHQVSTGVKNNKGYSPLFFAFNNDRIAKSLIKVGASIENLDPEQNNLFHFPIKPELAAAVCGFSVINKKNKLGLTPLITAIINGNKDHFDLLLSCKAEVYVGDNLGRRPLSYAAAKSNETYFVKQLLNKGANVNEKNKDGTTPIFYAESLSMFNFLSSNGAYINVKDDEGNYVIHYYVSNDNISDLGFELITNQFEDYLIDLTNSKGETALMYAAQEGNNKKFLALYNKALASGSINKIDDLYKYAQLGGNRSIKTKVMMQLAKQRGYAYAASRVFNSASLAQFGAANRIAGRKMLLLSAGKILTRAIPIVGGVMTIADIYSLFN